MKEWALGFLIAAGSFALFVLLPFGLAWALGWLLGAG